jgi:parallel beta-helix repeat protein
MTMKRVFILFAIFMSCTTEVQCKYWLFVAPNGNDLHDGSREHPLASLEGARDRLRTLRNQGPLNDTIFIHILQGSYFLPRPVKFTSSDGGTPQAPVIFTADPANKPVFYGGMKLHKFEVINKKLWRVFIPEVSSLGLYFEQLYINGQRRFRAQTPDRHEFFRVKRVEEIPIWKTESKIAPLAAQKIILSAPEMNLFEDLQEADLEDAVAFFYHNWSFTRKHIQTLSRMDTALYIIGDGMAPWNPINQRTRYVIENYEGALDAPGEWFLQHDGYLYYIPMEGENVDDAECIIPVIEKFLVLEGDGPSGKYAEHIRFENISFQIAGYKTPIRGNEPSQASCFVDATIMVDFARSIEFINCEIAHTGLHAIWFRKECSNNKVQHCYLHDLGGGGIKIGDMQNSPAYGITSNITVDNNIIQGGGYVFPDGPGVIIFNGSDNIITHNDIADLRYSGISVGWVWGYGFSPSKRNKIQFNHIHHLGWGELSDMGGVYCLGPSEGTIISNNNIHHIYSFDYGGWGLYTDEGSSFIVMENNLVYRCKDAGFHQHYGKENIIRNNIFAFNVRSQMQLTRVEQHRSLSFIGNVIYFDSGDLYQGSGRKDAWLKALTEIDSNCYWDTRNTPPNFSGLSFDSWKKTGKDGRSTIADPLFVDPQNHDFHFRNKKVAKRIGFHPFEYNDAGVYGDLSWKELARLDPGLLIEFDAAIIKNNWKENDK